ncbi:methylenetetrahydrofolate dehydrogenase (NAD(+)) [Ascoidea rubescens DSM 1968]|uniref:Methylenetetrahydrofolate dehydrogenase [NAD(+)] n=1 Tax=Ascoidea rubescens DSM 1968 TaxID=1344418 RepID=A0A1D2VG03_9ASCO|nr:tetrahydrofolate dehydrogenase/cyclohydrolase [Ascoidea rubescens DSM 1968]ODV60519.1 tetrahydrofolate dehydrogenase/cyclohydrolase [Ascoidea rubescens DSM 1968]
MSAAAASSLPKTISVAGRTIFASNIAKQYINEVSLGVKKLRRSPTLVGFLASSDPAAKVYANWTGKTSESIGFKYSLKQVAKEKLEEEIIKANNDPLVDGIMVYFPVFGGTQDQYIQEVVSMQKDVEGLNHQYISNMYKNIRFLNNDPNIKSILPCTPLAIVKILEYLRVYNNLLTYGNRLYGKNILIVNRSEIVGRPLAALLANDGATVYSVDLTGIQRFTRGKGLRLIQHQVSDVFDLSLKEIALSSDVIITGVPSPNYKFPTEYINDGTICINFSSENNFNPDVKEKASLYVPKIGKVTIAMLLRNLLRLIENKTQSANSIDSSISNPASDISSNQTKNPTNPPPSSQVQKPIMISKATDTSDLNLSS